MKKKIISLLLVLSAFLITSGVSAKEMSKDDVPKGTYMIGTHLFTRETVGDYNGTLTVRYIMLAARTINSTNINDMIIYLKNSRGKWVNAVTNEEVTVPDKVDIYYENSVEEFLPEIKLESLLSIESGQWNFAPSFDMETSMSEKEYEFELYEKTNSGYNFVAVSPKRPTQWLLSVDATNEIKTYVGRLAITNSKGEKIYSDYSGEVTVDTKGELAAPIIVSNLLVDYKGSNAEWAFDMYLKDEFKNRYPSTTGYNFELSEKTGSEYVYVDDAFTEGLRGKYASADISNETKTYVARLYITNSKGERVYSNYSEELTLDIKESIPTPVIAYSCDKNGCSVDIIDDYFRTSCNNSSSCLPGIADNLIGNYNYNVYEKNGPKVDYGFTYGRAGRVATITNISNEEKTYVAKLYLTNSKGEEVVSKESNEITISAKDILGKPDLKYGCTGAACSIWINYNTELANEVNYVVYEKTNESYTEVGTAVSNGGEAGTAVSITLTNEPKTYVARFYITNSAGEKLYSDYSDEVIINAKDILGKPVLEYSYEASEGKLNFNLKSDSKYLTSPENAFDYSVELYEENGESFDLIKTEKYNTSTGGSTMSITVPSDVKTYKARLYIKNSNSEKIYSDYSNLIFIDPNGIIQLEEVAVVGYEEENKQKVTYKFKDDIYTKYTNIEVLYMYEGKTDWELYSDTIIASEEFEIEQTFGQIPERISVILYKEVDGQRVYTSGYTISYDSDTPLLTGSGVAVEPETNKRIASYMFKNDIYTKYTNIEVSYMYADWELYSDTIEANKVFSIKYDDTQTPSKIKVRLYKIENGQRVYSKDTIL